MSNDATERVGPPMPTKRGVVVEHHGVSAKIAEADFVAIERRVLAKMTAIHGAADHVVAKFHELTKSESGMPLFKHKLPTGSLSPTAELLHNLVVEAIQGEVTL